jgi:xanthine dehydrogenase accessory factor
MTDWIAALAERAAAGVPVVLVTVLRADGSTPRDAGTKMVVEADAFHGTVGGGHLELEAITHARALLAALDQGGEVPAPASRDFALGPSLGQCCGGRTTLLFEVVAPVRWSVAVFGAGHVGRALVKVLAELPCRVHWVDPRPEAFPEALPPRAARVVADPVADAVDDLPPGCDVVVMTHSHQLDYEVVEAALRRGQHRYLGLIGSETKRARFLARLRERGFSDDQLARLTCPIGVPGLHGKLPAEIAVSVAAQLLQDRPR